METNLILVKDGTDDTEGGLERRKNIRRFFRDAESLLVPEPATDPKPA